MEIKREKPVACRWEMTMEMFVNGQNLKVGFLFDEEGVEDHTITWWKHDKQIMNEDIIPEMAFNYVRGLSYQELIGEVS